MRLIRINWPTRKGWYLYTRRSIWWIGWVKGLQWHELSLSKKPKPSPEANSDNKPTTP